MFAQTVKSEDIFDRLNSEAYAPEHIECAYKLKHSGLPLSSLGEFVSKKINNSIRGVTGELDLPGATIPMFRPADIRGGVADPDSAPKLTKEFEAEHEKSRVFPGDLVLGIAGSVGCIGRVPANVIFGNINGSSARISTSADHKSAFLLAYIQSRYGQSSLLRYGVGSVQKHLNLEDLPIVATCKPDEVTQKYIGDKVCQAERLRAWAKLSVEKFGAIFSEQYLPLSDYKKHKSKHFKMDVRSTFDVLTPESYPPEIEQYFRVNKFFTLGNLSSEIFTGNTQDDAEDSEDFVLQATSRSCTGLFLRKPFNTVIRPKRGKYLKKLDILLTCGAHDKKYIGKDVSIYHDTQVNLPSSKVLVVRLKENTLPASYVHSYLKSDAGYIQWQSVVRGISAGIHPSDVARIRIPVPIGTKKWHESHLIADESIALAGKASDIAFQLTNAAKLLVEALIEGQLTEAELIAAEQALQAGNDQLDRRILNRLKTDGIDGQGSALFGDLDELYRLLMHAEVDG